VTLIILFVSAVSMVLTIAFVRGCKLLPMKHIYHLAFPPEDLYRPIVVDNFLFHKEGFTRTYRLEPKYLDVYSIGFFSEKQDISSEDNFKGKIKAEFFWKEKLLCEKIVTSQTAAYYADGDKAMKHYKKVFLMDFEIPLQGKYKKDISVKLIVLQPDKELEKYSDSLKLFIAVNSIP